MPNPKGELSVFGIKDLLISNEELIWDIGVKVSSIQEKNLYGRADINSNFVTKFGLELITDNNPERHANFVGWPEDKPSKQQIAIELASEGSLRIRND